MARLRLPVVASVNGTNVGYVHKVVVCNVSKELCNAN